MAQSKLFEYNFTLNWQRDSVKIGAGDVNVALDTKAVAGVLASVGSAVAVQDANLLLKFSAFSLGTYAAVKGAIKAWNWLQATEPPASNILQLSAPESKKAEFDKLITSGELQKTMQKALQNPKQAIQNNVDKSVSKTDVDKLVKLLGDLRLSSVTRCSGEHGGNVHGRIVRGKVTENAKDRVEIIAPTSGNGNVVGQIIEAGAEATYSYSGGVQMIGGVSQDIQRHAIDTVAGNRISVSLKYSDRSPKFEGKYRSDQTVYDILVDVGKENKDKKVIHIKAKTGEIVDEDWTISRVESVGWSKNMTVVVEK